MAIFTTETKEVACPNEQPHTVLCWMGNRLGSSLRSTRLEDSRRSFSLRSWRKGLGHAAYNPQHGSARLGNGGASLSALAFPLFALGQ